MSRFFRPLRKVALDRGRTLAYLKYAIGEVVLIVVGILIALQVNNWNVERQLRNQADATLQEVLQDLEQIVDEASTAIADAERREAIMRRILAGEASEQDYRSNRSYRTVHMGFYLAKFSREGFDKLMPMADRLPPSYGEVVKSLKYLYREGVNRVENDALDSLAKVVETTGERYAAQHGWLHTVMDSPGADYLHFVLHDPFYRNDIDRYQVTNASFLLALYRTKHQASASYHEVRALLGDTTPIPETVAVFQRLPAGQLQPFAGRYRRPVADNRGRDVFSIALEDGQLHGDGRWGREKLFMTSSHGFVHDSGGSREYRFTLDGSAAVNGIDVVKDGEVKEHWPKLADTEAQP